MKSLYQILPPVPSWVFTGTAEDDTALTTYSFASFPFGPPSPDRVIIICIHGGGGTGVTLSSGTIGGVAATIAAQDVNNNKLSAIMSAVVPTGISGTVALTFNAAKSRAAIAGVAAYNLRSAVARDVQNINNASASSLSVSPKVFARGLVFGVFTQGNTGTCIWNAGAAAIANIDAGASDHFSAAVLDTKSDSPAWLLKATNSGAVSGASMAAASFA